MIQPRDDEMRTLDNTSDDDDLLVMEGLCAVFQCSEDTLRRNLISKGLLPPAFYIGRTPYWRRADVLQCIRDLKRAHRFATAPVPKRRRK